MFRELHIKAVANGFVVGVGCQALVYTTPEALVSDLLEYLRDPEQKEKQMLATARNMKWTNGLTEAAPAPALTPDMLAGGYTTGRNDVQQLGTPVGAMTRY